MKKTVLGMAVGVTVSLAMPINAAPYIGDFDSYFAFGDSLTDDGKLGSLAPPSLDGRFSNGPTYAELLAGDFTAQGLASANFALGGATAQGVDLTEAAGLFRLSTFAGQIATLAETLPGLPSVRNPLTSVFFGANDLFDSFAPDNVVAAAAAVESGIRSIRDVSANFDDFLVYNLSDLGATPRYGFLAELNGAEPEEIAAVQALANGATALFNSELEIRLATLRTEGFNIVEVDFSALFDDLVANIETAPGSEAALGIFDATTPCTVSLAAPLLGVENPFTCAPEAVNLLLFNDAVHPNAAAQVATADAARAALAPIPVPASMPLILGGLALLGWVGRRRAA